MANIAFWKDGYIGNAWANFCAMLTSLRVKKSAANATVEDSSNEDEGKFVISEESRIVMEHVRESRRLGKPLKFNRKHNYLLQRCLDKTPRDLCYDEEFERFPAVGNEIID